MFLQYIKKSLSLRFQSPDSSKVWQPKKRKREALETFLFKKKEELLSPLSHLHNSKVQVYLKVRQPKERRKKCLVTFLKE